MQIIPSFLVDKGFFLPLRLSCKERLFSKTYPSFLTVKEGSTSHLGLLPSGKKRKTALLGAVYPHLSLPCGRVLTLYPSPKSLP